MNKFPGKFIVLYGINNLGKTTQAKMLVNKLNTLGARAEYLKYPVYSLSPSGEIINNFLRKGNIFALSPREAQIFYAFNRTQYQDKLIKKLKSGITIVAEDYSGTSYAWGASNGVDEQFLKYINSHLIKEDAAFLLDGDRYTDSREKGHKFENNYDLIRKSRRAHLKFAREFKWRIINANLPINDIHQIILHELKKIIPSLNEQYRPLEYGNRPIIKIQRLSQTAISPKERPNATGINLYSTDYYTLFPYEKNIIQTGIKIILPKGYMGLVIDHNEFVDQGILTINKVIGPGYNNEINVTILNLSHDLLHICPGQKIARLLIQKIESPKIREEDINGRSQENQNYFNRYGHF